MDRHRTGVEALNMPEFFLELFSEEIPARMQARAADELARLVGEALGAVSPAGVRTFYGPRRIALAAQVAAGVAEGRSVERGPRLTAPEQALAGFLRKHGAVKDQLRAEGDFWVLDRLVPGVEAGGVKARLASEIWGPSDTARVKEPAVGTASLGARPRGVHVGRDVDDRSCAGGDVDPRSVRADPSQADAPPRGG